VQHHHLLLLDGLARPSRTRPRQNRQRKSNARSRRDGSKTQAPNEPDAHCDGFNIRLLLATAECSARDHGLHPCRTLLELLHDGVSLHARRRDELDYIQSVPLRVDERELQEGIQTGPSETVSSFRVGR